MLPLWIIDLREKSERKERFRELLLKLDNVLVPAPNRRQDSAVVSPGAEVGADLPAAARTTSAGGAAVTEKTGTIKETIEQEYKETAERESKIRGYYWRYSEMADVYRRIEREPADPDPAHDAPKRLYRFQCELVKEGQEFIRTIRQSTARPHVKVNVVVLGDVTEELSRLVMPSVAALIQKEKGRILASHIHQGMEIIGMLYIPSDINTYPVNARKNMRRTLTEIEMQRGATTIRGYDHMMLYQDVQNRTECHYGKLTDREVAEFLFQCLVNMYYACDESHPLISGTASADIFYFSMGACSVYFDTEKEDNKARYNLAMNLIRAMKSEGDGERTPVEKLHILNEGEYDPRSFFTSEALEELEVGDVEPEKPVLHPVKNYLAKHLKRLYYHTYLRFFTKRMHLKIVESIDRATKRALESISAESKRRIKDAPKHLLDGIHNVLTKLSSDDGCIPAVVRLLKELKESVSKQKSGVANILDLYFWDKIIYHERGYIPKDMEDTFMEYHDVYRSDVRSKNGGSGQTEMKKEAINRLNGLLSNEATILSRICRSVLLGIMLALAVVPVLNLVSPHLLDIGRVGRYAEWWSVGLFFVPPVIQLVSWLLYERRKRRAERDLQAIYLHDAYARVANRIESEIISFYNRLIALSERYEKRCEAIMKQIEEGFEKGMEAAPLVPPTLFNQPLIGGAYGIDRLLPPDAAEDCYVNINFIRHNLREIGKREYFIFINSNSSLIAELFKGVDICENLQRRVNAEGKEELVSKEQQEKEQEEEWLRLRDRFQEELKEIVMMAIQPRENATVGEKIEEYSLSHPGSAPLLRPVIDYTATNGELISSADTEFLDVKLNVAAMEERILPLVAMHNRKFQLDRFLPLYRKYLFITRWRGFNHFSFNRILPMEDFDENVRDTLVSQYAAEPAEGERGAAADLRSTLLLWALCPDDISQDWFRMFPKDEYADAVQRMETYREILNQED